MMLYYSNFYSIELVHSMTSECVLRREREKATVTEDNNVGDYDDNKTICRDDPTTTAYIYH